MRKLLFALSFFGCALAPIFAADQPATFKAGAYTFQRPEKWQWVPITPGMRAAQLKIEDEKTKKSAEVVFFSFAQGTGGDVQANIDRWLGMFQEPREKINAKVDKVKKESATISYVQAEGTYMSGMPGGPKTPIPDAMLQGAIIEGAEGNVFVRLTGPAILVKAEQKEFKKMVESAVK